MHGPRRESTSYTAVAEGEGRNRHEGGEQGRYKELALSWSSSVPISRMASPCPQHGAQNILRQWPEAC